MQYPHEGPAGNQRLKERVFVRTSDGAVRQYIPNRETLVFLPSVSTALGCVFDRASNCFPTLAGAVPAVFR